MKIHQQAPVRETILKHRQDWLTYAFAVVTTVAMLVAREYVAAGIDNRPMLILFILPIVLSSLFGGLWPGLLSTALAALGTAYLALPPYHSFIIDKSENLFQWGFLIISGVGISLIGEELRRALKNIKIKQTRGDAKAPKESSDLFIGNQYRFISSFLTYFIPAFAIICIGGYLYASAEIRLKQQEMRGDDQEAVKLATNSLTTTLGNMAGDILFLAKLPRLIAAINAPTLINLANLSEVLSVFSTTQGVYNKIRWIDETGMEKVRVNYEKGRAIIVPLEQLQDKSKRSFFSRASTSQAGSIYLSNFDLNVEHDQVETPYKPVIRAAIPLFDLQGQRRGIIVVNYHGQRMLDDMIAAVGNRNEHLVLLNRDGYYLYSINADDTWGFMLNKPTTLGNKDPEAWASMQSFDRGMLTTASGTWLWDSLHPMYILEKDRHLPVSNQQNVAGEYDYFWHVAMLRPTSELQTICDGIWLRTGISMGLLGVLAMLASIYATRSKLKIAQLDQQLKERANAADPLHWPNRNLSPT